MTMRWYVVHAYSGFEKKVQKSLRDHIKRAGMEDKFGDILVPTEDVVEMKGGKKVVSQKLFFPGYILVEMDMNDETWHVVRNTPKVTGFISSGKKPTPLSEEEVDEIINRVSSMEQPKPKYVFERGEYVKIIDGPFKDFSGSVEEVSTEKSTLKVMLTILGRPTPVELEFLQVEKLM